MLYDLPFQILRHKHGVANHDFTNSMEHVLDMFLLSFCTIKILLMMYYFSLLGATVCIRAKKDSAFPVLKYSYQNSSVFA